MGFMDNLNNLAKKAQDKIQEAQAKIQEVAAQVSSPGVAATPVAVQNWHYTRDGKKKIGPFSFEQMKDLAKSGTLLPSDMVMKDGTDKWKPASEVQKFFPASGSASPPPPLLPPVPPEPGDWHFTQNGQQAGPVTWTQLRQRATSGQLLATDMVWKNGMAAWAAASTINDLFPKPTSAPPPPLPPVPTSAAPPSLPAKVVANRVTGELNLVGRDCGNGGKAPLHIMMDSEEIGTKCWLKGINHLQFESTVGPHSVTLRRDAYLDKPMRKHLFGSDDNCHPPSEHEEEAKTYQVEFKDPGYYTLTFTPTGFWREFPKQIEMSYSPQVMDVVYVSEFRRNAFVGLWQEVTDSGLSFIFTHDEAMIRDDGFATKFRWIAKDKIELYVDGCDITAHYQILSLGQHELILMIDQQSGHFKRGITITEAATEAQRMSAEEEFKRREDEARIKRAQAAANFARVAGGVAAVLAAGGFAILCGAAGAASAAGGGGGSSSDGEDGSRSDHKTTPSSSGPRLTGPTTPQSTPARRRQVAALCGAVIVSSDERNFSYKKKCDCGHVEPGQTNSSMPSAGSIINSSFLCSKCKRMQEIRIQGS